jgi:hypothetical protein
VNRRVSGIHFSRSPEGKRKHSNSSSLGNRRVGGGGTGVREMIDNKVPDFE